MEPTLIYAYSEDDFGGSLPADPVGAALISVSVSVTLDRAAEPAELRLSEDGASLAGDVILGGMPFRAGDQVSRIWELFDLTKGTRIAALRLSSQLYDGASRVVLISSLPLTPGQSYALSVTPGGAPGGLGLSGGLASGARVLTAKGKTPVEEIGLADMVWTQANGFQPVLWHGVETRPARGPSAPVRLRRGWFGLTGDLLVAGGQWMLLEDGGPALAQAAALEVVEGAEREFGGAVTLHHLLLPAHEVLFANGLGCASLWPADVMARAPADRPGDWPMDYLLPARNSLPCLTLEEAAARLKS